MIAFLHGSLAAKSLTSCIVDVNGVGYELGMTSTSLASLGSTGDEVLLFTYLHVKDDGISLYGFISEREKELFQKLITVSGVGPKMALAALSTFSPDDLIFLIQTEDDKRIATIPGVGKKTAQRIVLELKGNLDSLAIGSGAARFEGEDAASTSDISDGIFSEAADALYAMGFTSSEVEVAFRGYDGDARDAGSLVRYGLKRLGAM